MSDNKADEYVRNAQACMEVAERISLRLGSRAHGADGGTLFNCRGRRGRGRRPHSPFLRATLIGPIFDC